MSYLGGLLVWRIAARVCSALLHCWSSLTEESPVNVNFLLLHLITERFLEKLSAEGELFLFSTLEASECKTYSLLFPVSCVQTVN